MRSTERTPVLECQGCGDWIRNLTPSEQRQISYEPYAFIVFCSVCRRDGLAVDERFTTGWGAA